MNQIHFATTNMGKVKSMNVALQRYGIEVVHRDLELPEPRVYDLRKIAEKKVNFAYDVIGKPCIAVDSGFYVHSLNGFPKSFVNFALDTIGVDGILKLVEEKPRKCEFRACLAYKENESSDPLFFESKVEGVLTESRRGEMQDYCWSELFLVFMEKSADKTWAEMGYEEYMKLKKAREDYAYTTKFGKFLFEKNK